MTLPNLFSSEPVNQTPKKPVTDEYQGVKVQDDYQWLEKDDDPAVKAWSDAQNQRTRKYLDKLPDRAAIEKATDRLVRQNVAELFRNCFASGRFVCLQVPATEAAANAGDPVVCRRFEIGESGA
jgi:hypothetical protein